MFKRVAAKVFVAVALISALGAAPAQAGPVGDAMCEWADSTCTVYGRLDPLLCAFSSTTCHL